jgi:hypothetical protein
MALIDVDFVTDPNDQAIVRCPIPAFPYDPEAQGDPLHAVAPAPNQPIQHNESVPIALLGDMIIVHN